MIDSEFLASLVCPIHRTPLVASQGDTLNCREGCEYPVFGSIPFLLPANIDHTHTFHAAESFQLAAAIKSGELQLDLDAPATIDPVVQEYVAHTNSTLYKSLIGHLDRYPIPQFPMNPTTASPLLLDIGCGWGRWCIAAARTGFVPVGIEPSLKLLMAAERVAKQLGVRARFVVADSRFLPFRTGIFDAAFSFGVLQHFSKPNVVKTLHALTSVMKVGATTKLHLVNARGLRGLYIQMRRGWSDVGDFDVRYWTVPEALKTFSLILGPSSIEVDGFFVQARREDRHMLLPHNRLILDISRGVTELSRLMPPLKHVADNFYVVSNVTGATA